MKNIRFKSKQILLASLVIFLGACAGTPQPTISLPTDTFSKENLKIGIAYIPPTDEATTHIFGADCLLCYAVASTLTSSLDTHLEETINTDELNTMEELILSEYEQRTENVELITLSTPIKNLKSFGGELGFAKKDFRPLKEALNVDILVVLEIYRHGAYRSFSSYIPNGDPLGHIAGRLYSVDLTDNSYMQYMDINETVQPSGVWDEPPSFPSVTTSYYQAVENTKQKIKDAL